MDPASLIGRHPVGLRDVPRVPGLGRAARHGAQLRRLHRPHAAAHLRDGRRGRPSRAATPDEIAQMAGLVARGHGRRRGRVRHQLRHHPPRRRRPADPQPLGRPRRARRAVPGRRPRAGRGVVGINGGNEACTLRRRSTTCSASIGIPFTYTALLTSADRHPPQGAGDPPCRAWTKGADVWPAGVVPPADVLDDHGRAVHAEHQPGVRRADAAARSTTARAAYADPAWRQQVRDAWAPAAGRSAAALGDLRDDGVDGQPGARRPPAGRDRRRARRRSLRPAARPHRSPSPTLETPGARPSLANDDVDGVRRCSCRRTTARSACPTPAPTSASCATPRWPPTCSATGCASKGVLTSRRRSTS